MMSTLRDRSEGFWVFDNVDDVVRRSEIDRTERILFSTTSEIELMRISGVR